MIPARDPNAPPDPSELRPIPSTQYPMGTDIANPANPVMQGDPPPGHPAHPGTWTGKGDNVPATDEPPGQPIDPGGPDEEVPPPEKSEKKPASKK